MGQPLAGLKVLEIGAGVWGSYCTKLLADFGAAVVKVEPPTGGDPLRAAEPCATDEPALGGLFCYLNTNKRSLALDSTSSQGRRILGDLVGKQDVVVEELGPLRRQRAGLAYPTLRRRHPRLVLTSVTPFGEDGPYARFYSDDLAVAALAGLIFHVGEPGREPLRPSGRVADVYLPGTMAALGTLIALQRRHTLGVGDHVMVSALESILEGDRFHPTAYAYRGQEVLRAGTSLSGSPLYENTPCQDGYVAVLSVTDTQWEMLTMFLGRPELAQDPRFDTVEHRSQNWAPLRAIIREGLGQYTRAEAFTAAQEWRLPFGYIARAGEVPHLAQHVARDFFVELEAGRRQVQAPGCPFRMDDRAWQLRRPAPQLGEHTSAVLQEHLGLTAAEVEALQRQGLVSVAP